MRLAVLVTLIAGCGGAAAPPARAAAWAGPVRSGAVQRVAGWTMRGPLDAFAGTWRHDTDEQETLEIDGDGSFDWIIERGSGAHCEIAGTTAIVDTVPPQLAWSMTVNTCNEAYQGKTSNDVVVEHEVDRLTLQDAQFSEIPPVSYVRAVPPSLHRRNDRGGRLRRPR